MKTALARTIVCIGTLAVLLACAAGMPLGRPDLALLTTVVCLLGAAGGLCLLLRRLIEADDRARELGSRLQREEAARQRADAILAETQTVLSRLLRQHESTRDGERVRIAAEIQDELGQLLLALRADLSLLQVSSNGVHPGVCQKTGNMILTLDQALRAMRAVVDDLRGLPTSPELPTAG
jgi:signal transduction histidine kinase